jgi:hypothetical protein
VRAAIASAARGRIALLAILFAIFARTAAFAEPPIANAPAPASEPVGAELVVPVAPSRMHRDDALQLLQGLGVSTSQPIVSGASSTAPAPSAAEGVSRTIEVPAPSVVNRAPRFEFRDATRRDGAPKGSGRPPGPGAAMETFRQSVAGGGSAP